MADASTPTPPLILIVDDDERIRRVLEARLLDAGFLTRCAGSGEQALTECKEPARRPDLVLLDVMMPGKDGFQVCSELKANPETRSIAVVLLTALDGQDERARGLESGAEDFLTKPFNGTELVARVKSVLGMRRLERLAEQRATVEALVEDTAEPAAAPRAGGGMTALLVEDDHAQRELYAAWLRDEGHEVTAVGTFAEGIAAINRFEFDLLVLDVLLPDGDGREIARRARGLPASAEVPILMLTSLEDSRDKMAGFEAGADDYVVKPIDAAEFRARVGVQARRRAAMLRLNERLRAAAWRAVTDSLTGAYGRSFFDAHLRQQVALARRYQRPLSVLMLDIDHFKLVNDALGHPAGDAVIRGVAERLRRRLRIADVLCRYGGEEFAIILPETGSNDAFRAAEELRELVGSAPFIVDHLQVPITLSVGVATAQGGSPEELVAAADRGLYRAKALGRNRTELGSPAGWTAGDTPSES